jgi:hypothetical protein
MKNTCNKSFDYKMQTAIKEVSLQGNRSKNYDRFARSFRKTKKRSETWPKKKMLQKKKKHQHL